MLSIKNVQKFFGGLKAVNDISLNVNKGSITGLIGPNGAGKTTLFNTIAGIYAPDNGKIYLEGDEISGLKPHDLLSKLNDYGYEHGIGREDIVENRFVGMKSRGVYETPGGTILLQARRAIESITIDREVAHLKD